MKSTLQFVLVALLVLSCGSAWAKPELPKGLQWEMLDWVGGAAQPEQAQSKEAPAAAATKPAAEAPAKPGAEAATKPAAEAAVKTPAEAPTPPPAEAAGKAPAEKPGGQYVFSSVKQPTVPGAKAGLAILAATPAGLDVVGSTFAPDGKPDAVIRVAIKEPGASVASLRIDNLGGKAARWQTELVAGAMPMAVFQGGALLNPAGAAFSLPGTNGDSEQIFEIAIQDNGAIAAGTKLRLTIFLDNKQRRYAAIDKDAKGE